MRTFSSSNFKSLAGWLDSCLLFSCFQQNAAFKYHSTNAVMILNSESESLLREQSTHTPHQTCTALHELQGKWRSTVPFRQCCKNLLHASNIQQWCIFFFGEMLTITKSLMQAVFGGGDIGEFIVFGFKWKVNTCTLLIWLGESMDHQNCAVGWCTSSMKWVFIYPLNKYLSSMC